MAIERRRPDIVDCSKGVKWYTELHQRLSAVTFFVVLVMAGLKASIYIPWEAIQIIR